MTYLGHHVSAEGIGVDKGKVSAIVEFPPPTNARELRRFLGLSSYYRKFIDRYADLSEPLSRLLRKNQRWIWSDEQKSAFEAIKCALTSAPVLTCPDFSQPFYIQCDSSNVGIGCTLGQKYNGNDKVIAYFSRGLTDLERKYSTCEKECLAVVCAVRRFRPYIEGYKFFVYTDCQALKWLHKLDNPSGRLARWSLELQQYNFEVLYRKGTLNSVPDALSRIPEASNQPIAATSEVRDWYDNMMHRVRENPSAHPTYRENNGVLFHRKYRRRKGIDSCEWQMCVRLSDIPRVLEENHCEPTAGHLGRFKTVARISAKYFWPGMYKDISNFVKQCASCQRHKVESKKPGGLMRIRPVQDIWQSVSSDLIGKLPYSSRGNQYLLLFQDNFSKYVEFKVLRNATAQTVGDAFEKLILYRWGAPLVLTTDNGGQYNNQLFAGLAKQYKINHTFTPPYSPQCNPVERTNRTIKGMIRRYCENNHKHWDKYIEQLIFAWNTSVHTSTGYTPSFLVSGREPILPSSLHYESHDSKLVGQCDTKDLPLFIKNKLRVLQCAYETVRAKLKKSSEVQKKSYDLRRRPMHFKVGEKVLKRNYVLSDAAKHFSASLAPRFVGPFIIKKCLGPNVYELEDEGGNAVGNWHVKDLKKHCE
jgi:transposase